jgi:hypothetical protein
MCDLPTNAGVSHRPRKGCIPQWPVQNFLLMVNYTISVKKLTKTENTLKAQFQPKYGLSGVDTDQIP